MFNLFYGDNDTTKIFQVNFYSHLIVYWNNLTIHTHTHTHSSHPASHKFFLSDSVAPATLISTSGPVHNAQPIPSF